MKECCDCQNKADYAMIYQRSLGYYCNKCIGEHISRYKPKAHIVPIEFIPEGHLWPVPTIFYNDVFYIFGKTKEEYETWLEETNKSLPDICIL